MNIYKSRIIILFFLLSIGYVAILINLFIIQIWRHAFFQNLADKQYHISVQQFSPRAFIYDRHGTPLAMHVDSLSAFIMPRHIKSMHTLRPFLKQYFPTIDTMLDQQQHKSFLYVKRKLSPAHVACIQNASIPDIHLLSEPCRFYSCPCASIVVGLVNQDNHGISGMELLYNQQLQGAPAHHLLQKDGRSQRFYFSKTTAQEGHAGTSLFLTLDSTLQFLTHQAVEAHVAYHHAKEGFALIMNPTTGEILAMTQVPSIDLANPHTEYLTNHLISDAYEFGSIMKIFVALAALEQGVVQPDELIDCKQTTSTYLNKRKINTVKEHGIIPFQDVVAFSNNIGIAHVALRLQEALYTHYIRLGFGKKTTLPFPGQTAGFVQHPACWSAQSIFSLSYGYEISASILQLAVAFSMIANGGYSVDPLLVKPQAAVHPQSKPALYSSNSINALQKILEHTTKQGTARRAAMKGYRVMCKTGTAIIADQGAYNPDRCIFTCAGIVEKDTYRRVLVVCIKEIPQQHVYASTIAVPLFEKIAEQMLIHDKVIV